MRFLKLIFLLAMIISLLEAEAVDNDDQYVVAEATSLRGVSRLLAHKSRVACNKACPFKNCCKKRCVNVARDRVNCGKCGHKCKFSEICCKGKCINPFSHKKHCGGCGNKCDKGTRCTYGLCSYSN